MATPRGWPSLPRHPACGDCRAAGPGGGSRGCLAACPLSLPNRAAAKGQGAQRRHQPARATGAAGAHGTRQGPRPRSVAETPTDQHPRAGAESPPSACASPAGVACWPPRARGARRAPRARSAAEHKMTGRARRARTRGATQTDGGAKRRHEGGGPRERRRTTTPTRREEAAGADLEEAAAQPGRRSQGRAPGGREQPRTEQRAKEPGRPRRASVQAARRTATRRAAKCHPAQRVAGHNWPGAGGTAAQRAGGPRARIVTARTERGGAGGRIASSTLLTAPESVSDGLGGMIPFPVPLEWL